MTGFELFVIFAIIFGGPFGFLIAWAAEPNKPNPTYTAATDTGRTGEFENLESVANWFFNLRFANPTDPPTAVSALHRAGWVWEMETDPTQPDGIRLYKTDPRSNGDV